MKKLLALLMALCMLAGVTAAFAEDTADIPLVVATSTLSQKFSPFFADTAYDQDVVSMTQISMMTTDRVGGIIYNGIEGETIPYNGTETVSMLSDSSFEHNQQVRERFKLSQFFLIVSRFV